MGTMGPVAMAAEDVAGAPVCSSVQQEDGGTGLLCNNLTEQQSRDVVASQGPEAYRRCYRQCTFRVFRFCLRYRVRCYNFGRGHHH